MENCFTKCSPTLIFVCVYVLGKGKKYIYNPPPPQLCDFISWKPNFWNYFSVLPENPKKIWSQKVKGITPWLFLANQIWLHDIITTEASRASFLCWENTLSPFTGLLIRFCLFYLLNSSYIQPIPIFFCYFQKWLWKATLSFQVIPRTEPLKNVPTNIWSRNGTVRQSTMISTPKG